MASHGRNASGIQLTDIERTLKYERKAFRLRTNRRIIKKTAKEVTRTNLESYNADLVDMTNPSQTCTSAIRLMPGETQENLNLTQVSDVIFPYPQNVKYKRLSQRLFKMSGAATSNVKANND